MSGKRIRPLPDIDKLREALAYSPTTGTLRWKVRKNPQVRVGAVAGYIDVDGYRTIQFDRVALKAHRVIWAMRTGAWPDFDIDHRDTNRDNNRWRNLRPATKAQNGRNRAGANHNSSTGALGVFASPHGTYRVVVRATFKTLHAAKRARRAAAAALHGGYAAKTSRRKPQTGATTR